MFDNETQYPEFKSAPAPVAKSISTTYRRETQFTAVNLLGLGLALAAGWVFGNARPALAFGVCGLLGFVLAVRVLFFRGRR